MSTFYQLDFEKPVIELERRLTEAQAQLKAVIGGEPPAGAAPTDRPLPPEADRLSVEIKDLSTQREQTLARVYADLSPWHTVRVARHPQRPQTRDYIAMICRDFCELHGDRRHADDPAIVAGLARFGHTKVMLIGHQKGRETSEKLACHFGCAHPEGYRKALLKMKLAEKMGLPVVTLVDTPGAYPGLGAEQRGQAEAIAVNMLEMSRLKTPIVSVVIGEGGSGGALGIAVADRVGMMQYAWYTVISPEGCAAILWKEANEQTNAAAAKSLRLTAADNLELGIVDAAIPEPLGGAHRDPRKAADNLAAWVQAQIAELKSIPIDRVVQARYDRFRRLGSYIEADTVAR
ncbi:MAG: acetyl-CoA carboxylase carboxyltransferase subunit alpha [Phycisphaeraceae bacterium]|nr:MAG: acetyl-CoA carboxylase carboxyltransferase subunit alpha [Phycisphaeraceae bacterium]